MESRASTSLKRSTSETWSVCERASVRTMKSKSAAVNRARQFALTIGTSSCAMDVPVASQIANGARNLRQDYFRALLTLWRINRDRIACRSRIFLLSTFSRHVLDFPGDCNRLKRVRRGKPFQKLLNLRGFVVFDNHINFSLARLRWQPTDPLKSSPPVSRPSMRSEERRVGKE